MRESILHWAYLTAKKLYTMSIKLPAYGWTYYHHLMAEFEATADEQAAGNPEVVVKLRATVNAIKDRAELEKGGKVSKGIDKPITWDDVYVVEMYLVKILPPDALKRKAWIIRARYLGIAGQEGYLLYNQSTVATPLPGGPPPPNADGSTELTPEALRADLITLLQDIYWLYRLRTDWEERRNWLAKTFAVFSFAVLLILVALILWSSWNTPNIRRLILSALPLVTLLGAVGGFVSLLRRLQSVSIEGSRLLGLIEMEYGKWSLLFQSLFSGSIFALILLLIFAAGLVKGDLFPDLHELAAKGNTNFVELLWPLSEENTGEFHKLLVWSFIAGFAEQFVPDILDQLTTRQQNTAVKGT